MLQIMNPQQQQVSFLEEIDDAESSSGPLPGLQSGQLHPFDVIVGRTSKAFNNAGNQKFRHIVGLYVDDYRKAEGRCGKSRVVRDLWHCFTECGFRFLQERSDGTFEALSDQHGRRKVSHALRDASARHSPDGSSSKGSSSAKLKGRARRRREKSDIIDRLIELSSIEDSESVDARSKSADSDYDKKPPARTVSLVDRSRLKNDFPPSSATSAPALLYPTTLPAHALNGDNGHVANYDPFLSHNLHEQESPMVNFAYQDPLDDNHKYNITAVARFSVDQLSAPDLQKDESMPPMSSSSKTDHK